MESLGSFALSRRSESEHESDEAHSEGWVWLPGSTDSDASSEASSARELACITSDEKLPLPLPEPATQWLCLLQPDGLTSSILATDAKLHQGSPQLQNRVEAGRGESPSDVWLLVGEPDASGLPSLQSTRGAQESLSTSLAVTVSSTLSLESHKELPETGTLGVGRLSA